MSVDEDAPVGTKIFRLPSPTSECCVVFSLLGSEGADRFHLMPTTGELLLTHRLDRESHANYSLKV